MYFAVIMKLIIGSSAMAGLLVVLLLIVKKVFKKHISARWQYLLWFLLILRLAIPYVAYSPINVADLYGGMITKYTSMEEAGKQVSQNTTTTEELDNPHRDQKHNAVNIKKDDNTVVVDENPGQALVQSSFVSNSLQRLMSIKLDYKFLFLIWILGVTIFSLYGFLYNIYFWAKVKNGTVFTDQNIIKLLEDCKEKIGIQTNISIIQTSGISIPAIFGVTRPWLLMPEKVLKMLEIGKIRYIILHELVHLKRKDIHANWIVFVLQIVHWFNPLVWFAFYKMRSDRELACDADVLMHLEEGEEKKYGHTILDMVAILSGRINFAGVAGILEDKSQFKDRITRISGFHMNKNVFSVLTAIIVVILGSSLLVNASDFASESKETHQNVLINNAIVTPIHTPESTITPTRTPKPTDVATDTPEPTITPVSTPTPTPKPTTAPTAVCTNSISPTPDAALNVASNAMENKEEIDTQNQGENDNGTENDGGASLDTEESFEIYEYADMRFTSGVSITERKFSTGDGFNVQIDRSKLPEQMVQFTRLCVYWSTKITDNSIKKLASEAKVYTNTVPIYNITGYNWINKEKYQLVMLWDDNIDLLGYYIFINE